MPLTDRREIEFDADALVAAVATSLRAAARFGLPAMAPHGVHFHPKEGEIAFLYGAALKQRAVRLKAEAVGAILVAYCIRARLPMPRQGEKGVRVDANSVVLMFSVQFTQAPRPAVEGHQSVGASPVASWIWVEPTREPSSL